MVCRYPPGVGREDGSADRAELYPDVVEAGSLPDLLSRALDEAGSSLSVEGTYTFASVLVWHQLVITKLPDNGGG